MKKTVCLLLAVVMLLSLVACGKKAEPSQSESTQIGVQTALFLYALSIDRKMRV